MPIRDGVKVFALRLPDPIYEAIQRWAQDDLRSMNSQVEKLLVDALLKAGRLPKEKPKS